MKGTSCEVKIMENLLREIGELQNEYQNLLRTKKLTKKAMCNLVIPFRDKYNLTDLQALQVARNELSLMELAELISESTDEKHI